MARHSSTCRREEYDFNVDASVELDNVRLPLKRLLTNGFRLKRSFGVHSWLQRQLLCQILVCSLKIVSPLDIAMLLSNLFLEILISFVCFVQLLVKISWAHNLLKSSNHKRNRHTSGFRYRTNNFTQDAEIIFRRGGKTSLLHALLDAHTPLSWDNLRLMGETECLFV